MTAITTVNTPNENIVLSYPIPKGLILPSLSKTMEGLLMNMRIINSIKKDALYMIREFTQFIYYYKEIFHGYGVARHGHHILSGFAIAPFAFQRDVYYE